jgi:hypothetical protein
MATKRGFKPYFGWLAFLLVPIVIPLALIGGLLGRPARRTPGELISLLEDFLDGTDDRAWDEFESIPLNDSSLEEIRKRAVPMGPPNANEGGLRSIISELKAIGHCSR